MHQFQADRRQIDSAQTRDRIDDEQRAMLLDDLCDFVQRLVFTCARLSMNNIRSLWFADSV